MRCGGALGGDMSRRVGLPCSCVLIALTLVWSNGAFLAIRQARLRWRERKRQGAL